MLTQTEARELCLRSAFERRRPSHAFIADRIAARARRMRDGHPHPYRRGKNTDWVSLWSEYTGAIAGGASYFNLVLDTTAPAGTSITINGGATHTATAVVSAVLVTSDDPTTGYQIKIWGNVDTGANGSIQATEGASAWISPTWSTGSATQSVTLSSGDGSKTLSAKIRDDVWNETSTLTDSITVDTTLPVVTITSGPDVTKISKISGKRVATFAWESDVAIANWEVAVVANSGSARGSGTVILTTNGSTNVSGTTEDAETEVTTTIDGRDLEVASTGDGTKVIKVFVQEVGGAGSWSA